MRLEGRVAIVTGSASRQQGGEASSTMTLLRVVALNLVSLNSVNVRLLE